MADLHSIVIVGNGVAGMTAGDTLRRLGYDGALTIIGEEPHATYSRPALSKVALAPSEDLDVGTLPDPTHGGTELLGRTAVGAAHPLDGKAGSKTYRGCRHAGPAY